MPKLKQKQTGFTIVELLIVIVVIAILASISIVAYAGIQERGRVAQATSDVNQLYKAILAARINTGKTLFDVTGANCTRCQGVYSRTLDRLSEASGMNLESLKNGDPWGNEYQIDENEGEYPETPCRRDSISVLNNSAITAGGKFQPPFSLPQCV